MCDKVVDFFGVTHFDCECSVSDILRSLIGNVFAFFSLTLKPFLSSQCSASCGGGMQMRKVVCVMRTGPKTLSELADDRCNITQKLAGSRKCSVRPCSARWYVYPWQQVCTSRSLYYCLISVMLLFICVVKSIIFQSVT